jgi:hypothetical protein
MLVERLDSWNAFLAHRLMAQVSPAVETDMLFRGQANHEWSLTPSLLRAIGPAAKDGADRALELEQMAQEEFEAQAHLYLPASWLATHKSAANWWALMQHYRAPTRLLDWSLTPFVAAYFACSTHEGTDGAIWALDMQAGYFEMPKAFDSNPKKADKTFTDPDADPSSMHLMLHGPRNERMTAQQGVFMFSDQVLARHDDVLADLCRPRKKRWTFGKLVIPAEDKPDYLKRLSYMNINARSLFPGIDGLGQSVFDIIRIQGLSKHKT